MATETWDTIDYDRNVFTPFTVGGVAQSLWDDDQSLWDGELSLWDLLSQTDWTDVIYNVNPWTEFNDDL